MTEARAAFRSLVIQAMAPEVQADRIFPSGDVDTPKGDKPFAVVKWEESTAVFGLTGPTNVDIWFYDCQRTYSRLSPLIQRCKDVITVAEHVVGTDGFVLTQADWVSDSVDLYDDMHKAVLRKSTYRVAARYTEPSERSNE